MGLKAEHISLFALAVLGLSIPAAVTGVYFENHGQPAQADTPDTSAAPETSQQRFTKEEFDKFVLGKTKEQIRDAFGPPHSVQDSDDSWLYEDLPIYDQYAGTQSMVRIIFEGIHDRSDRVSGTHFF